MSLFGKGNWTRMFIKPEDLGTWETFLKEQKALFFSSAFVARTILLGSPALDTTVGINPPSWPMGDGPSPRDQITLDRKIHPLILANLQDPENQTPWEIPEGVIGGDAYDTTDSFWGADPKHFQLLNDGGPIYGFWLVLHSRAGLDDMNALKEHAAATSFSQPFKTLGTQMKKDLCTSLESDGLVDYIARVQCPVIINFETGDIWIGTGTKKLIDALKFWMFRHMAIQTYPVKLNFGGLASWAQDALAVFVEKDIYALERSEAFDYAMLAEAEEEEDEEVEREVEAILREQKAKLDSTDENKFTIDNISVYSDDNVQFATVHADAAVDLGAARLTTVTAKRPLDALALLKNVGGASLSAARVIFKDNIGDGIASTGIDFTPAIGSGSYKGLDLDFSGAACEAMEIEAFGCGLMDDGDDRNAATGRVNRYWLRYLLMLCRAERMMIEVTSSALELDPANVAPKPEAEKVKVTKAKQEASHEEAPEATGPVNPPTTVKRIDSSNVKAPMGAAVETDIEI